MLRKLILGLKLIPAWVLVVSLAPIPTNASTLSHVVISEVQTGAANTKQEFIELYNPANLAQDISEWKIQYKPASDGTEAGWTNKISLTGFIEPRGYFLLSAKDYLSEANIQYTDFMAISSGHIRIVDSNGNSIDKLGWGAAVDAEGSSPAAGLASNQSLQRKFTAEGKIIDTDDNSNDFIISISPSPETSPPSAEPEEPIPTPEVYPDLKITELFVDPIAPQTDDEDEFIELYNDNDEAVQLKDYRVKTGSSLQYSFTLPEMLLQPNQHAVFFSKDYNLTLPNSGGKAQLFDPNGEPRSELVEYEEAQAGEAWVLIDDIWQWSASPTPLAENILSGGKGGLAPGLNGPLPNLVVNEVLINPSSPQSDSNDEFVEIFNPNPYAVELSDYQLQTGSNFKTHFTLPPVTLASSSYIVFYSKDSNISLSNSGGGARLVDTAGNIISEAQNYDEADEGDAWAKFESGWQWTSTPTPGSSNVLTESAKATKKAKVKAAAKKSTAKKATNKKSNKKTKAKAAVLTPATVPVSPLSSALVAVAASVALVYGLYEFRYDIRNKFELAKRNIKNRWNSGP